MQTVDEFFLSAMKSHPKGTAGPTDDVDVKKLKDLLGAQMQSRHLDFAARWLQSKGRGYYTIGSAGHESNAAVALASQVQDPALLHYRSGGFYAARATKAGNRRGIEDVLASLTTATSDPISGGRHKVFGHRDLNIIPQTSTIASHLPRAVGLAYALGMSSEVGTESPWPADAVVLCSFGDASLNHSTAAGALNAAAYLGHRGLDCPVLFICEDNGIGISTRTPRDWAAAALRHIPGVPYWYADGAMPQSLLKVASEAVNAVRTTRRPGVLHLKTVRFMGHAGSDAEIAYRTRSEILADYQQDPLLNTARTLVDLGVLTSEEVLGQYAEMGARVMALAENYLDAPRLDSREAVLAPLTLSSADSEVSWISADSDRQALRERAEAEDDTSLTLAESINATLRDRMAEDQSVLLFGEDVAAKGGVYGVTRGLQKKFGIRRVFDTLLDEQTILGTALGASLAGYTPVPEIQYLAYLHNAEDQIRGEAATLRFFSAGQYHNGMVVRIAGLAYQRGFGGHFHNDNSVAVLRDIPGIVVAVPSHPAEAPGLLRSCLESAQNDGRVCVFVEPIALYHTRDLHEEGDGGWTSPYIPPKSPGAAAPLGQVALHGSGSDILLVSFGNGVRMSRRVADTVASKGVRATVLDLRWLAPLPVQALIKVAQDFPAVLVVDETRSSGGVSEAVLASLVDSGYHGRLSRVASADSFVPLGPAAETVLLGEKEIIKSIYDILGVEL